MMGPTHATLGAGLWLVAAPAVTATAGQQLTPTQMLVGAAVSAGFGLWPDMAKEGSTIARSFGPVTEGLAWAVNKLSMAVVAATRTRRDNPVQRDSHRKLTHTAVWAFASAAAVAPLVAWGGRWAALGLMFFALGLALRGLMSDWAKRQGWLGTTVAAAAATFAAEQVMPAGNYWWLSLAVLLGTLSHSAIGDLVTKEGTPLVWPIPIKGKRWYDVAPPGFLRITTNGWIENAICLPVFTLVTAAGCVAAFTGWGQVVQTVTRIAQSL